jgi:hypothetical protein
MKYLTVVLFVALAGVLFYLFFAVPSAHEKEMLKLIHDHTLKMDSAYNKAEEWRLLSLEYGNQFRKEAMRANKAEERYNYLREENEILKKRPVVRYAEPQLDSIFKIRYPQ